MWAFWRLGSILPRSLMDHQLPHSQHFHFIERFRWFLWKRLVLCQDFSGFSKHSWRIPEGIAFPGITDACHGNWLVDSRNRALEGTRWIMHHYLKSNNVENIADGGGATGQRLRVACCGRKALQSSFLFLFLSFLSLSVSFLFLYIYIYIYCYYWL